MRDVYEVLQQKEAAAANVRHEIQSLKLVCSLLPGELALEDVREPLQQREADVAVVRQEIESLKIVAPLLLEESASDELANTRADPAAQAARDRDDLSNANGTDGPFSSWIANPRPTVWNLLKRRT